MSPSSASSSQEVGAQREHESLLGAVLGGTYRVDRVLGRGPLGTVFQGEQLRLRRPVTIKVLARRLVMDVAALATFHREAETVSQLQHPNLVQLLDFDTTEAGEPYLVMESLTGENLAGVLEQYGRLDVRNAARIVHQAACGLHAAHRAGIVHGDLKPTNVFLVEVAGEGTLVKLLDFGIRKFVETSQRTTGEHTIRGDPEYRAPEQALGRSHGADERIDQYSLAVIAFEAISGRTPFSGRAVDGRDRTVASEAPPIERLVPELPSAVGRVLERALARDPGERFPGVLEFAFALLSASGSTLPPARGSRPPLRALFEDPPTPPPRSFIAPRPDGRYHTLHDALRDALETEPPGPHPKTEPPGPEPETEPPLAIETLPPDFGTRSTEATRLPDINRVLDQAREALGLGDVNLAVSYAEHALHLAAVLGGRSRDRVDAAGTLIEAIFRSHLGAHEARLVARPTEPEHSVRLSPEEAFLLSRLDTPASVDEILDVSPLPRRETLRRLSALVRRGLVGYC